MSFFAHVTEGSDAESMNNSSVDMSDPEPHDPYYDALNLWVGTFLHNKLFKIYAVSKIRITKRNSAIFFVQEMFRVYELLKVNINLIWAQNTVL